MTILNNCKLTYFAIPGRGESIRLALAIAGIAFTDERIPFPEWPKLKPNTPFGSLPLLTLSTGESFSQQRAILRAVGTETGLYPKDDLKKATLLHDTTWADDWATWLQSQGLSDIDPGRGPTYSLYSLAVDRCVAGDGVLIGHTALTAHFVKQGVLMTPFPDLVASGMPICIETPLHSNSSMMQQVVEAIIAIA